MENLVLILSHRYVVMT